MKRKRFSVEQIVAVLKQADVAVPVVEVCRQVGITEQTFYRWKAKYLGLEIDQVRQIKRLRTNPGEPRGTGTPGDRRNVSCFLKSHLPHSNLPSLSRRFHSTYFQAALPNF